MTTIQELEDWASQLTVEKIKKLPEEEILNHTMERPGHPGQYGFIFMLGSEERIKNFDDIEYALLMRLSTINNLKEKMQSYLIK